MSASLHITLIDGHGNSILPTISKCQDGAGIFGPISIGEFLENPAFCGGIPDDALAWARGFMKEQGGSNGLLLFEVDALKVGKEGGK